MNKIHTLEDDFDFEEIELEHPNSLQGGSYFTRINIHSSPVYIQTNPCSTKSGIVKTAKKSYCDLMFNSHDNKAIQWFEELERRCIDAIYQKKDLWFHNDMELDDIETAFTSPIRLYKSGKNYLIRCNIANTSLSSGTFKCYDEHTNPVSLDKLDNTAVKIIPLLEVQGIRFTSKNFTLELALKQIMIIEDPDFMNECFIQPGNIKTIRQKEVEVNTETSNQYLTPEVSLNEETEQLQAEAQSKEELDNSEKLAQVIPDELTNESAQELVNESSHELAQELAQEPVQEPVQELAQEVAQEPVQEPVQELAQEPVQNIIKESVQESSQESIQESGQESAQELTQESLGNSSPTILDEVKLDYNNLGSEAVKLKSPEEVYYDLWYEARTRAKLAREEAIRAYLEAKNIKNTYMLDNFSDSDDEFEEYLEE